MSKLATIARNFVRDEQAATTAEYGIIVVVMAAIAVAVLTTFDTTLDGLYADANKNIDKAGAFDPKAQ
jgi:Flp pilus assembly pilin Flp